MANIFQKIAVPKVHFSNFNLTHDYSASFDFGYLIPCLCVEALPNDTFQGSTEAFLRLAPLEYPLFQRMSLKAYTFFVPNRILWKYWPEFIAEDEENVAPSALEARLVDVASAYPDCPLIDYLGFPEETYSISDSSESVSILPFLAYQKIWNDYFRDENLQDDLFKKDDGVLWQISQLQGVISLSSAGPRENLFALRKKAWEKDYFTSALPEPQLGDPVPVPVRGDVAVDVNTDSASIYGSASFGAPNLYSSVRQLTSGDNLEVGSHTSDPTHFSINAGNTPVTELNSTGVTIGVSGVNGLYVQDASFTINDLRLASSIQRFNELLARAGHRYKETILSMFNQVTPDYRLDRPEFICSCNIPISISEVPQTSATVQGSTPQATLAGNAIAYNNAGMYRYHCQEHGFIVTLICAIPRTKYANGLSRMWTRKDRYDYYTPVFENLGEQAIKNREVYLSGTNADDEDWGYAPRYSEYKYIPSTIHGEFRNSLDFMTLSRIFDSLPTLSGDFITPDDETCNRGFAVADNSVQHLYVQVINHLFARRPMQKLPIPKLV